jgi:hypothetical protein
VRHSHPVGRVALLAFAVMIAPAMRSEARDRCTIRGTSCNDKLIGTPDRDITCGLAGRDQIVREGRGASGPLLKASLALRRELR